MGCFVNEQEIWIIMEKATSRFGHLETDMPNKKCKKERTLEGLIGGIFRRTLALRGPA